MLLSLPLLLSLACSPDFRTVDEACHSEARGSDNASAVAEAFQRRVDCHRRVAGLQRVRLTEAASNAAQAHATYQQYQGALSYQETEGEPSYTGQTAWDRLITAGYDPDEASREVGLWEVVGFRYDLPIDDVVDQVFMPSFILRDKLMIPTVAGAGYGDADSWLEYLLLFEFPADARVDRPVAYPASGQVDVPTSAYALEPGGSVDPDWLPWGELRGYPLTLSFGATSALGSYDSTGNVYDIHVSKLELEGPDGQVAVDWTVPGDERSRLQFSVAVVPLDPLEPSTSYTLRAQGTTVDGKWSTEVHFSTRLDDTPANQDWLEALGIEPEPVSLTPVRAPWQALR